MLNSYPLPCSKFKFDKSPYLHSRIIQKNNSRLEFLQPVSLLWPLKRMSLRSCTRTQKREMFSSSALLARPSHSSFSAACLHCEQLAAHLNLAQFQSLEWPNVGILPKVETIEFWTWRLSVESPK